jgi:CSLREA domain-containing protein
MVKQDSVIRHAGLEYMIATARQNAGAGMRAAVRMRAALAVAMAAAFALVMTRATANATTYTVNTLQDTSGEGDCSLRDAINAANRTLTLGSTCTIAGAGKNIIQFSVTGTILLASTLPQVMETAGSLTINGPASPGITIDGSNSGNPVQVMQVASGATLTFKNVTITNGSADILGVLPDGGGIYNAGTLTVSNSTFSGNNAEFGSCILNSGTLKVSNSTFSGNSAEFEGCIVSAFGVGSSTFVSNSIFSNNESDSGSGIYNQGTMTVINSIFSGNTASDSAGIANDDTMSISNSTFSRNSAAIFGGALTNSGTTLTVTDSTFSQNDAGDDGGGAILNDETLTITNSTFSGNHSPGDGGGINNLGALTVTNSTFSGNSSNEFGAGGGIFNDGTVSLTNTTFSGNTAVAKGGAIDTYLLAMDAVWLASITPSWRAAPISTADPLAIALELSPTLATTSPMTPRVDSPRPALRITVMVSIRYFPRLDSSTTAGRLRRLRWTPRAQRSTRFH